VVTRFDDGANSVLTAPRIVRIAVQRSGEPETNLNVRRALMAAEATLRSVTIEFQTINEDKDASTAVLVVVKDRNGLVIARAEDTWGGFPNNSRNGPYDLVVVERAKKSDVESGSFTIRIDPAGNDTWRFNVFLNLRFSDDSHLAAEEEALQLSSSQNENTFGIP
jgi:hypothetical protein